MSSESPIIITSLERTVQSLEDVFKEPPSQIVRDAAIQRFEYTFELAIKMIRLFVERMPEGMNVDQLSYRDLCRVAAETGLITDAEAWFGYREARNATSHAYDEKKAEVVYQAAVRFAVEVRTLVETLKKRI